MLEQRLGLTIAMLSEGLESPNYKEQAAAAAAAEAEEQLTPLVSSAELKDVLMLAYDSLNEAGLSTVADGRLKDLIRQVSCFGLCLLPLDVRQESTRHAEAIDAITRYLGVGSYLQWDEQTRVAWLTKGRWWGGRGGGG